MKDDFIIAKKEDYEYLLIIIMKVNQQLFYNEISKRFNQREKKNANQKLIKSGK